MKKLKIMLHIVYMSVIILLKVEFAPHLALVIKGFFFAHFRVFVKNFCSFIGKFFDMTYNKDNMDFTVT